MSCIPMSGPRWAETESRLRLKAFAGFEVNDAMMARAKPDALFMHCLPAHRGEGVAASVIDGPQSVVSIRRKIGSMRKGSLGVFGRYCAVSFLTKSLCRIATIAVFFLVLAPPGKEFTTWLERVPSLSFHCHGIGDGCLEYRALGWLDADYSAKLATCSGYR